MEFSQKPSASAVFRLDAPQVDAADGKGAQLRGFVSLDRVVIASIGTIADYLDSRKNQYERKLRDEWQFRKNLKADEWEHVLRKVNVREASKKQTRVTLQGLEISQSKIKKEKGRYPLSDLDRILFPPCKEFFQPR